MKAKRITKLVLAAGLLLFAANSATFAESIQDVVKPLALQGIMKDLGTRMQVITDGISREDWPQIAKIAPLIADHPQPPAPEKALIMGFIGSNMGRFKGYDDVTHEAAETLHKAAEGQDGQAVINAFQALQTACYNCHRDFRKPFVEHFYGNR